MVPSPQFAKAESPIPEIEAPFAVLSEADEKGWRNDSFLNLRVGALLAAGCRYFVCFGSRSEEIHDRIDDVIVEHDYGGVTTTFHGDESAQDVADFFETIALSGMSGNDVANFIWHTGLHGQRHTGKRVPQIAPSIAFTAFSVLDVIFQQLAYVR